jgi:hypothetical protein
VEYGTDSPGLVHIFYIVKMALYLAGALAFIVSTPGIGGLSDIGG